MDNIPTFEELLQRCLDKIPNTIDKRQGSVIYNSLAPACVELAQMYIELASVYYLVFIDTAVGGSLDSLVRQNGLTRNPAAKALRKGEFNMVVPVGSRFSDGINSYIVTSNIPTTNNSELQCETAGEVGNEYYGSLTPISYITGLTNAELTDIIDVGINIESDEALRARYMESVTAPQFGGNINDYKEKAKALIGVGGCKVIPIWNGGGTVKLIITNSTGGVPTQTLVDEVQAAMDPTLLQDGLGIAPIGHAVTVVGATGVNIAIVATFTLQAGVVPADIQTSVNDAIDDYFDSLSEVWDSEENIIVRISQIETKLLNVSGVVDIVGVTINSSGSNISLLSNEIPLRNGDVVING